MLRQVMVLAQEYPEYTTEPWQIWLGIAWWGGWITAWILGITQYFRGNHIGLGWTSVFVPFVFIGGYFIKPKPGSARYMNYDPTKKATADLRWPMHAKAYHDLMGDKESQRSNPTVQPVVIAQPEEHTEG